MLPRLSHASWWRPVRLPLEIAGISSPVSSVNAPMSSVPSSTEESPGSTSDVTLTPNGVAPACAAATRAGRKAIATCPSASGKSGSVSGVTVAQRAASPSTWTWKWSTTAPVLRIVSTAVTSDPGSTCSRGVDSTARAVIVTPSQWRGDR